MSESAPIICFGQQPCGFFPKRFLVAKFSTARRLQAEIGGERVFFYHDADHDPRETMTSLRDRKTGEATGLNFRFANKIQKKYSPLFAKRVVEGWKEMMARQLPKYVSEASLECFQRAEGETVADFCLSVYREMGLLEGVRVVRSGDPVVREAACAVDDYFVDVQWEGELVRARRCEDGALRLHCGGEQWIDLPATAFKKTAISPTRDSRMAWMQSVIECTHYVAGASEMDYLDRAAFPEIQFLPRDAIDRSAEAHVEVF